MKTKKKRLIILLSIAAIVIGFTVWDIFIDPPAWWRFERQQDKLVISEYVERNYPNAKNTGGQFPIQKIAEVHRASTMYFELDEIEFKVSAEYGKIVSDGYPEARATAQIDDIIKDGFLKPKNLTAGTLYRFHDDYNNYPYTGNLYVELRVQGLSPQDVGWLYDFYGYWKKEGEFFSDYRVDIYVNEGNENMGWIVIKKDSEFADETEFYSAFKICPYW